MGGHHASEQGVTIVGTPSLRAEGPVSKPSSCGTRPERSTVERLPTSSRFSAQPTICRSPSNIVQMLQKRRCDCSSCSMHQTNLATVIADSVHVQELLNGDSTEADFTRCSTNAIAPSSSMNVELKLISSIQSIMPRAVWGTVARSSGLMPTMDGDRLHPPQGTEARVPDCPCIRHPKRSPHRSGQSGGPVGGRQRRAARQQKARHSGTRDAIRCARSLRK